MRYHSQKTESNNKYGKVYFCNHPVYNRCTLFLKDKKGLCVIQQRFDHITKSTYWTEIDSWLTEVIFEHPDFNKYFESRSGEMDVHKLYPTVTIRQIMWALRIKPLPKESWETVFDRKNV